MGFKLPQRLVADAAAQENFEQLEGEISLRPEPPEEVTALPASPTSRQEVYLRVDETGTYGGPYLWHCRYDDTAGQWIVVSGHPLVISANAAYGFAVPATPFTYSAAIPTPKIVLPYSGDWVFEKEVAGQSTNAVPDWRIAMFLNGGVIEAFGGIGSSLNSPAQFNVGGSACVPFSGALAGTVLDMRAASNTASVGITVYDRTLKAIPRRLDP